MRGSFFRVVFLCLTWPFVLYGQPAEPATYDAPQLTLERLMRDDPVLNPVSLWTLSADPAQLRALVEKQANSGKLVAQLFLGEAYIPPECTFLPFKTAPADCPDEPSPGNLLGVTRSFDTAIHWLGLASEQGSGEASEVLAQVMERAIRSRSTSAYKMTDVARYHALARSQGYDLEDVQVSCYRLDERRPVDRLVMGETPAEYRFTPQELETLHAAGAAGTLHWGGGSGVEALTTMLRHPEGPMVHTRMILGRPPSHEILVPMADHVDVVFLQEGDRVVTVP